MLKGENVSYIQKIDYIYENLSNDESVEILNKIVGMIDHFQALKNNIFNELSSGVFEFELEYDKKMMMEENYLMINRSNLEKLCLKLIVNEKWIESLTWKMIECEFYPSFVLTYYDIDTLDRHDDAVFKKYKSLFYIIEICESWKCKIELFDALKYIRKKCGYDYVPGIYGSKKLNIPYISINYNEYPNNSLLEIRYINMNNIIELLEKYGITIDLSIIDDIIMKLSDMKSIVERNAKETTSAEPK